MQAHAAQRGMRLACYLQRLGCVYKILRSLQRTYLSVDPRSLGAFRIGLGSVLLVDLLRRYLELEAWYTNGGLLPNHTLLWRPPNPHVFSLFFVASETDEARLGFALCGLVYLAFTLGYRTRAAQLLTLICRISVNSRLSPLENGGDTVLNLLCVYSVALPLGQRLSIDAWLTGTRPHRLVRSLAMSALILQFAVIYLFNALNKDGQRWRDGSAVHYALHLDKYATSLGVLMREQLPAPLLQGLCWGTLAVEWSAFVLLITPVFASRARALACVLLPALHLSFALALNLGGFSVAMLAFFPLLLDETHWRSLARGWARCPCLVRLGERVAGTGARLRPLALRWLRPSYHPPRAPRLRRWAAELAVAMTLVAVACEALNTNACVPGSLHVHQPSWAKSWIEYARLYQGWHMFAPNPPETDSMLYVDAVTSQGNHVDPYNLIASRQPFPAAERVPQHMDQSQYFTMYSDRIAMQEYSAYRQALLEWLIAYPARTHRPADCLVSLDVYYVTDRSPPLGSRQQPSPVEKLKLMHYDAPAEGACRAQSRPASDNARELAVKAQRH